MTTSATLPGLFVTGTDTNVGKTHVAARIVRELQCSGFRAGAYKPVCSGATVLDNGSVQWEDIERLRDALDGDWPAEAISPQRFLAPLGPPLAARAEGRTVDFSRAIAGRDGWREHAEILVVEGVGGLLAPVTDSENVADLAAAIGYPLIIVARCGLGTINHSLLTIEAAQRRGLSIAGVVLNQCPATDDLSLAEANAGEIESRGKSLSWELSAGELLTVCIGTAVPSQFSGRN